MTAASQRIDEVPYGGHGMAVQRAAVSAASSGSNVLVAGVAGYGILALAGSVQAASAVTATFRSATGTDLTGTMTLAAGKPLPLDHCPLGHFRTQYGEDLCLALSGAVQVSGWLEYVLVPTTQNGDGEALWADGSGEPLLGGGEDGSLPLLMS